MIWHIVLAALLTWLVLTLIVHVAMFVAVFISFESHVSQVLMRVGFYLSWPVFAPVVSIRRYIRYRRALWRARAMARCILVSLPEDERDVFMERLRSGKNRKQTIIDALHRVRELSEASK